MQRRATVRDVAAAAGVSQATASRALSGNPKVSPDLARRVLAASRQLGYTANVMARALRTQQTGTIGVVVPAITNPYFISAVEALERVLADSERSLVLCDAQNSCAVEAQRIELLLNRMVDGLVVVPVARDSAPALRFAAERGPVVQFDRFVEDTGTDFVGADNVDGVRQAVSHLRERGAASIAYVGAEPTSSAASERLRAYQELAQDVGREGPLLGEFSTDWGQEAARRLLAGRGLPDAVMCGSDTIAVGLLAVLRDAGVAVPGDLLVASYDDSPMGRITSPRLTSVRQPVDVMAREAVRLLDDGPNEQRPPRKSIFTPSLVVRESTGAVRPA
jgi:LacI family transcriptional regulator